ncbi:MAG: hypothetical protein WC390_06610 [Sulfurimonas sp.]
MTINGTKSTPGPWEYYREEIPSGKFTHIFETVRQKGGKNIVRLHNEADAQMIALTPDALEAIAIALVELEKIRTEKLAVCQLATEANAVSAARVALQRILNSANVPRQVSLAGADAGTEKSGSEGATPAVLEAGSVPERVVKGGVARKLDRPAISCTNSLAIFRSSLGEGLAEVSGDIYYIYPQSSYNEEKEEYREYFKKIADKIINKFLQEGNLKDGQGGLVFSPIDQKQD